MRSGQLIGGPIATPIRDMLKDDRIGSVIFHCEDISVAANTQAAAGMLRYRNDYKYRTRRRGNTVTVYKGIDPLEGRAIEVNVYAD